MKINVKHIESVADNKEKYLDGNIVLDTVSYYDNDLKTFHVVIS